MVFLRDLDRPDICGYLGNNLFQLAAGYSLATKNKDKLYIPEGFIYKDIFKKPFFDTINSKFFSSHPIREYTEPHFHFEHIPYVFNMNLNGYYQSWRYFFDINVKELFEPKDEIKSNILNTVNKQLDKTYDEIFAYHRITSCHLRLGDYLNFSNVFVYLAGTDYYEKAMEKLIDQTDYFLVFSNNIEYCKEYFENLKLKDKIIFSESEQEKSQGNKSSVHDLYLMSMCNNFIIANSSFSWWSAMLGDSLKKKVIAPKNWFVNNLHDTRDLIPEGWERI